MTDEAKALVEECRLDAKAFRENTVYDSDGDPIRLIANADRLDQYADLIETQAREIERLTTILSAMNDTDVIARTMAENERLREALVKATDCSELAAIQIARATIVGRAALAGDSHD